MRTLCRMRPAQATLTILLLSIMLLASACGGTAQVQQQASQNQEQLDRLLQHAQAIGVPASSLNPIIKQEQQLIITRVPFNLSSDQPAIDYYRNLATRYEQLEVQVQGLIASSTEQYQKQAQQDMQTFQTLLTQRSVRGLPVKSFEQQFRDDQTLMATAQYPKDYATISAKAHTSLQALDLMLADADRMTTFKKTVEQMQGAHIDVTLLQTLYQSDQQTLASATTPADFQKLSIMIDAQYQQAVVSSTQALPYVTAAKLSEFEQQVKLLQTYGMDASAYQKRLAADRATMSKTLSIKDYVVFSQQVDADMASMHADLVQGEAGYVIKQFHAEADAWGKANPYHDPNDGNNYPLDAGYLPQGIGSDLDLYLSWAVTPDDFQAMVDEANNDLFNLHMLEADYKDPTPYDQVHATDMQLLNHYNIMKGQVIMVSMVEQAMRIYQDGKLVRAFHVTTGRVELPVLPGIWPVQDRQSPTIFKSPEPKGSPYWYPDTPIHYAILYHHGGYYIHDSWWRADYGPGTQFPHTDSGGDVVFSNNGSHGCINMQLDEAAWVYNNTNWQTQIVIY